MRRAGEILSQGSNRSSGVPMPFLQGQNSSVQSLTPPCPLLIHWPLWYAIVGLRCSLGT